MNALEELTLNDCAVGDEEMKYINRLPNLTTLNLNHTNVGDKGVRVLAELPELANLDLASSPITDDCAGDLARFEKLIVFDARDTGFSTRGRAKLLAKRPNVEVEIGASERPLPRSSCRARRTHRRMARTTPHRA
jgi:hypothetical protein